MLLSSVPQFAGSVIVRGSPNGRGETGTRDGLNRHRDGRASLKTFVDPAAPFRVTATSADLDVGVAQLTAPKLMF